MRNSDLLKFESGGRFSTAQPWIHSERTIDTYELIFATKGTIHLFEEGTNNVLNPDDYLLLSPNKRHGGSRHSQGDVEFFWLHFNRLPEEFQFLAEHPFGSLAETARITQIIRLLLHCSNAPAYPTATADHLIYVLLAELAVLQQQSEPQNALAARTHEFIRSYSYRPLTAAQVASELQYHPDHLSRVLKKCYGFTLQQDINNERINRAKQLLLTTDRTVSQIALELGYEDPNLFEKFFRYHAKIPPLAFRNSFSGMHTNHK